MLGFPRYRKRTFFFEFSWLVFLFLSREQNARHYGDTKKKNLCKNKLFGQKFKIKVTIH